MRGSVHNAIWRPFGAAAEGNYQAVVANANEPLLQSLLGGLFLQDFLELFMETLAHVANLLSYSRKLMTRSVFNLTTMINSSTNFLF